jgi:hypothetical protein
MKDKRGLYYYPSAQDRKIRMYVRENDGTIQFRMWNQDFPAIWNKHGWIDHESVVRAAGMYKEMGRTSDPLSMYDIEVAKRLIRDEESKQ